MNKHIAALSAISAKPARKIIGLMSGTSLDGLDIALCNINGSGPEMKLHLEHFITAPYDDGFKEEIKKVFAKEVADLQHLTLLNSFIANKHAAIIKQVLAQWEIKADDIDLIASHGQTIYHAPLSLHEKTAFGNGTLQVGDGDHIAVKTGIITISDFRQKHIAAGGEGAPLAAYGDYLLFTEKDTDVMLLNIGGIANFTYLPANDSSAIFSTDVGPGNTMMDAFIQQLFPGQNFDNNAELALQGTVNDSLLEALCRNNFLSLPLPKTTGPELFNASYLQEALDHSGCGHLQPADLMATLNRFTALTIERAIKLILRKEVPTKIYASGGGAHNPMVMDYLVKTLQPATVYSTEEKGINPDAKEAILFAILANECVAGDGTWIPRGLANFPPVTMGKLSFPG